MSVTWPEFNELHHNSSKHPPAITCPQSGCWQMELQTPPPLWSLFLYTHLIVVGTFLVWTAFSCTHTVRVSVTQIKLTSLVWNQRTKTFNSNKHLPTPQTHWLWFNQTHPINHNHTVQIRFMSNQRHFTLFCEILICLIHCHNLTSAGLLWTDEFNVAPSSRWRWHASFCSNIYASHELRRGCFLVHMWIGWLHSCLSLSCITVGGVAGSLITIFAMCSLCRSDAEDERSKGKNEVSGEWDCSKWTDELLFISESCHHQILSFVNRDQIKKKKCFRCWNLI